jgi:hypothetical protein
MLQAKVLQRVQSGGRSRGRNGRAQSTAPAGSETISDDGEEDGHDSDTGATRKRAAVGRGAKRVKPASPLPSPPPAAAGPPAGMNPYARPLMDGPPPPYDYYPPPMAGPPPAGVCC